MPKQSLAPRGKRPSVAVLIFLLGPLLYLTLTLVFLFVAAGVFNSAVQTSGWFSMLPSGQKDRISSIVGLSLYSIAFIFAALLARSIRRARRHIARTGEKALAKDRRPPVVYLRSFAEEAKIAREEEDLARILSQIGPVVAVGRPGEALPPLGASRFYVPDDDWQSFVAGLLQQASLVLVLAGRTTGLVWEMKQCRQFVDPRRLVVLVPTDKGSYQKFREHLSAAGLRLPEYPNAWQARFRTKKLGGIVIYNEVWEPQFRPFKRAAFRGAPGFLGRSVGRKARLAIMVSSVSKAAGLGPIRIPGFNWGLYLLLGLLLLFVFAFALAPLLGLDS